MTNQIIPADIITGAQAAQARYYVPSSVSISQWAIESAWGLHFPKGSNNPFGIKARADQAYVSAMTWEVEQGRSVRLEQRFAKYASVAEAFDAHAHLLASGHLYKPAMDAWYHDRDLETGIALMAKHYATDPAYATKLLSIIHQHDLVQYDSLPQDRAKVAAAKPTVVPQAAPADPSAIIGSIVSQRPDLASSDLLASLSKVLGSPAQAIADTVGSVIAPGGPSPATSVPEEAADEPNTGNIIMDMLPILASLFGGVSGKLGVATTIAGEMPRLVEGTIKNVGELPKAKAEIDKLVSDIKAGNWGNAPADIHVLLGEFGVILSNYGVSLPGLTAMVDKLPGAPAIAKAA